MRSWILIVVTLVLAAGACRGCDDRPQPSEAVSVPGSTDPVTQVPEPVVPAPAISPEQHERYRRHLAAGRRLGQQGRWGDAVRELEAALEQVAMDPRALSELGWAAFQAGDYERARTANLDALRAATDPPVRAASMYNLGRVAEAAGDLEEAERQYRASLALRPSELVDRRLAGLRAGAPRTAARDYRRCGPSATAEELCACVIAHSGPLEAHEPECNREQRQVAGAELLFVGNETEEWVHLIGHSGVGWSTAALLGYVYRPVDSAAHEELEIARFETRMIGEHKVLWIETVQTRTGEPGGSGGSIQAAKPGASGSPQGTPAGSRSNTRNTTRQARSVRTLTLCTWPSDGALECPLMVPLIEEADMAPDRAGKRPRSGAAARTRRRLEVAISEDGVATIVLVEGAKTDELAPLLGEHKLW